MASNKTDTLSTAVSSRSSSTTGLCKNASKKMKQSFFSIVKAIFSKSSTETKKNGSGPFHNAVKNTYVVRENHGTCTNNLQMYGKLNDETNSEKEKIFYEVEENLIGNQRINNVLPNDDNLANSANENAESAGPSAKNNSSWITTSTNTSQGTLQGLQTNCRDMFTEHSTLLPNPVDVGIQTKIPSCYKVYLLHKHVSHCGGRNKLNSKVKKKIFINRDKKHRSNNSYQYYKNSSTSSICADESQSDEKMEVKHIIKSLKENSSKNNTNLFDKNARYYGTDKCVNIEFLKSTDELSGYNKILNLVNNSNSNIKIDNDDGTTFSGTPLSNSSSYFFDTTESQNMKNQKPEANHKTTDIQKNESYRKNKANTKNSRSKSLPSLTPFRRNKRIKENKSNSSPLVSYNTFKKRIEIKKESTEKNFIRNSKNIKEIKTTDPQTFRFFLKKEKGKCTKETLRKNQPVYKTSSISSEETFDSDSENSNPVFEIKKKGEINNATKIKAKRNQITYNTKLNKRKTKLVNSNSTITEVRHTKRSAIRNDDLNKMKIEKKVIISQDLDSYDNDKIRSAIKQNPTYQQNNHLTYPNADNVKLQRRPIITQPMIFFNGNFQSEMEYEIPTNFFNKNVKDVTQLINSPSNLKIPLGHQYFDTHNLNSNHPIMSSNTKCMDNAIKQEPKKKVKNHKNKDIDNSRVPIPAINKKKVRNRNKKYINNLLDMETNNYVSIEEINHKSSKVKLFENQATNCISEFFTTAETFEKSPRNNYTTQKPSAEIFKKINLTEVSFETNVKKNQLHTNKQAANKTTQKNWNENYSSNNKSKLEKKIIKNSKNVDQEIRILHDIQAELLRPKIFQPNVGVHGAFSGNITSKRKTFFAKITPMHTNK